ncbi:MAG TPA: hypothetical protein VK507_03570, partial [Iamia sp.]|nr:hypothetical protein [Iamia sp.]
MDNLGLEAAVEEPTIATTYRDSGDSSTYITVVTGASDVLEAMVPLRGQRDVASPAGLLAEFDNGGGSPVVAVPAPEGEGLWKAVIIGTEGSAADLRAAGTAAAQ